MHVFTSLSLSLSLNSSPKTLTPPRPPPTTTGSYHEHPLLVVIPPYKDERFNQSEIFIIYLKDSIKNKALNPFFVVSSR